MRTLLKPLVVIAFAVLAVPATALAGPNPYGECSEICDWTVPCSTWCTQGWPGNWRIYNCSFGPDCAPGLDAEQPPEQDAWNAQEEDLSTTCNEDAQDAERATDTEG